jgi:hypothetical protein
MVESKRHINVGFIALTYELQLACSHAALNLSKEAKNKNVPKTKMHGPTLMIDPI